MATSKPDAVKTNGIWATAQGEVDAAAERLHLDEGMHRVLRMPKRELTVHFPLTHDDGRVEVYAIGNAAPTRMAVSMSSAEA